MAETTPNQSEPAENKNAEAPKPSAGLPPKSPPPPGAGGPPKSPPPPGAGAPPKSPAPPGAGGPPKAPPPPGAGGPPKAPAPPGAGGPPKTPAPPVVAGGPPRTPAPPAAGGPPKPPAPPTAGAPVRAPLPSAASNPLGQVPKPPASTGVTGSPRPAGASPAAANAGAVARAPGESTVSRREFLNYVWGASMALFLVQFGGLSFFFALPRARLGEFGGIIPVGIQQFLDAAEQKMPIANNAGKFWIVNTENGINALYKVCTHLGCIYPWSDAANRFACPCHGSQFQLNGDYIAGPAPRSLDRFQFQIQDASGAVIGAGVDGLAVPLPAGAATILVDTGKKVTGKSHL